MEGRLRFTPGVAGVDEAGRGPLAGPVFAAAVVLPRGFDCEGVTDSKALCAAKREELAERIRARTTWSVAMASVAEIDRLNILWASMLAMRRAVEGLKPAPERAIIDGNKLPPNMKIPCKAEVDGDARFACIAAASILAKTARDAYMKELCKLHPGYGFGSHFGYPTPEHRAVLKELGPCIAHRRAFAGVEDSQLCLVLDA